MGFTFDWSLNIGNILTVVSLLTVFFTLHSKNVRRLQAMETKLNLIYGWFKQRIVGGTHPDVNGAECE